MPPPRPEFIQLERGEDVPSVRDRLSFHNRKRVLLIWPEEGSVLTRKLDLVLIQRDAMRRGIQLALVTHDPQVIKNAAELNISTFETIGASERSRWRRGRTGVFSNRFWRPKKDADTPDPEELMPVASRVRGEEIAISRTRRLLGRVALLLVIIGALAALAIILLPNATVTIIPAQTAVNVDVLITADLNATGVNIENAIIPATRLSVTIEETSTIATTGKQSLGSVPAQGSVVFVNQGVNAINVPQGTIVSTSAGTPIIFQTLENATVPAGAGQQIEVPIEAMPASSGEVGNVDSGLINVIVSELSGETTVRNISPTFGGTTRTLNAVTQEDRDHLLATVRQQLQSRAYVEMLPRLDESQFLILETVTIAEERGDWTTFSAQPGDAADTLTLTMRAIVEATAINEQFGQQIVFSRLGQQIPRGRILVPESIVYERGPVQNIYPNGQADFQLSGKAQVIGQIDAATVRDNIAGQSVDDARAYMERLLDLQEGIPPQINIMPEWFGRLPLIPFRITVYVAEPNL